MVARSELQELLCLPFQVIRNTPSILASFDRSDAVLGKNDAIGDQTPPNHPKRSVPGVTAPSLTCFFCRGGS